MDVFNRLLDTTPITLAQFGWALVPAVALLVLWEAGKLAVRWTDARRRPPAGHSPAARPSRPELPAPRRPVSSRDVPVPSTRRAP